eukprot:scaffold3735_cov242-Ochromonas_danica.AAC.4
MVNTLSEDEESFVRCLLLQDGPLPKLGTISPSPVDGGDYTDSSHLPISPSDLMEVCDSSSTVTSSTLDDFLPTSCPTRNTLPRDLRTRFAKKFEDGMNASDPDYLREVLNDMLDDKTIWESFRMDNLPNCSRGKEVLERSIMGKDSVINHYIGFTTSTPDSVFLIHEWKLFSRPNKQSCLIFKFSFTGSQIYEFDSTCMAEDNTHGYSRERPNNMCMGDKCGSSTVTFREMNRNTKYESRKRPKFSTIGEYVESSRMREDYAPLRDQEHSMNSMYLSEETKTQGWDNYVMETTVTIDHANVFPTAPLTLSGGELAAGKRDVLVRRKEAKMLNMCGFMRFHINSDHLVYKIQCVHIHQH